MLILIEIKHYFLYRSIESRKRSHNDISTAITCIKTNDNAITNQNDPFHEQNETLNKKDQFFHENFFYSDIKFNLREVVFCLILFHAIDDSFDCDIFKLANYPKMWSHHLFKLFKFEKWFANISSFKQMGRNLKTKMKDEKLRKNIHSVMMVYDITYLCRVSNHTTIKELKDICIKCINSSLVDSILFHRHQYFHQ